MVFARFYGDMEKKKQKETIISFISMISIVMFFLYDYDIYGNNGKYQPIWQYGMVFACWDGFKASWNNV